MLSAFLLFLAVPGERGDTVWRPSTMVEVCEGGLKVRSREPTSPGWTAYDQCRSYFCEHVFMSACSFDQEALRNNELRKQTFATYEQATEWQRGSGAPGAAKADERGSRAPKTRAAKDSGAPGKDFSERLARRVRMRCC